jgi:hypothetical protein
VNFNFLKSRLHTLASQTSLGEVTGGLRLHALGRYTICFGALLALHRHFGDPQIANLTRGHSHLFDKNLNYSENLQLRLLKMAAQRML